MRIRKLWKRGIAMMLSVIMLAVFVPMSAKAEEIKGNGYTFDTETGELAIKTDAGTTAWRDDTNISKEAVKSVEFQRENGPILNIGANAFDGCTNLTGTIKLNAQTRSIGKDAFKGCNNLEVIMIPTEVQSDIAQAAISAQTTYVIYEFNGDTLDFCVQDIRYGAQKQIVFDGGIYNGITACGGCAIIAKDSFNIIPAEIGGSGMAWYYSEAENGEIIVTKYTPVVWDGVAQNRLIEIPQSLAGHSIKGFSDTAFSDHRLSAAQIFVVDDSTNITLPDNVSKLITTEENGTKEAYFTPGNVGSVEIIDIHVPGDVKMLYAKDILLDRVDFGDYSAVCYKANNDGTIIITNVILGMFSHGSVDVPTVIKGNPVTTVMLNTYNNYRIDNILVDGSVNKITYEYDTDSYNGSTPVIQSVTQGSGQKYVELPTEIGGMPIDVVEENAFDKSVTCVIASEKTEVKVPSSVGKITYKEDEAGNVVITDVIAGKDETGKAMLVNIPTSIGGNKPIMSDKAKEDMKDIPHTHNYDNGVCTECGDKDPSFIPEQPKPNPSKKYEMLDGANSTWTSNKDGNLVIRGNGEIAKFKNVKVDGAIVDVSNYTVTEGSTIITFKADYLKTLSIGSHTVEIVWIDGSASTSFTVEQNQSEGNKDGNSGGNLNNGTNGNNNNIGNGVMENNSVPVSQDSEKPSDIGEEDQGLTSPKTGDNTKSVLWVIFIMVLLVGFTIIFVKNRRSSKLS